MYEQNQMSWQISLSVITGEAFKAEAGKHIRHPDMWDAEAGRWRSWGQLQLHCEPQAGEGRIATSCLLMS